MDTDEVLQNDELLEDSLGDLGIHITSPSDDDKSDGDDDISDELKNFGIELDVEEEKDNADELDMDSYDDQDDF